MLSVMSRSLVPDMFSSRQEQGSPYARDRVMHNTAVLWCSFDI
jgi:hypothetical protein